MEAGSDNSTSGWKSEELVYAGRMIHTHTHTHTERERERERERQTERDRQITKVSLQVFTDLSGG